MERKVPSTDVQIHTIIEFLKASIRIDVSVNSFQKRVKFSLKSKVNVSVKASYVWKDINILLKLT